MSEMSYMIDKKGTSAFGEDDKSQSATGIKLPENKKMESPSKSMDFRLDLSNKGLLNGIILSEVLGRPKYFRKGR